MICPLCQTREAERTVTLQNGICGVEQVCCVACLLEAETSVRRDLAAAMARWRAQERGARQEQEWVARFLKARAAIPGPNWRLENITASDPV